MELCRLQVNQGRPWYVKLNIEMAQFRQLAELLLPDGVVVYKERPDGSGAFKVFALVKEMKRPGAEVEAAIAAAVGQVLGVVVPAAVKPAPALVKPVPPAPSSAEWEQAIKRYLNRLDDRGAGRTRAPRDRLAVVEWMLAGKPDQALKRLNEQRASGIGRTDLARQYVWVHAELGNWAEVVAVGEEAGESLEGSLHTQRRLGEACLQMALVEPEGTSLYGRYLTKASGYLNTALHLAARQQDEAAEATIRQLLARVCEQEFRYPEAANEALRAFVLLARLDAEAAAGYQGGVVGPLKLLGGAITEPEVAERLYSWLSQVPDAAQPVLSALGLTLEALRAAGADSAVAAAVAADSGAAATAVAPGGATTAGRRDWAADLVDLRTLLADAPAEAGSRAEKLQALPDVPLEAAAALRLYERLAQIQVTGRTDQTLPELQALKAESFGDLDQPDQVLLLAELIRAAGHAGDYAAMREAELAFSAGAMPADLLPLLATAAVRDEDWDRALAYVSRAHEQGLHSYETYLAEARVRRHREEWDQAYEAMTRAMEEKPGDLATTQEMIETLFLAGDWGQLITTFNAWREKVHDRGAALAQVLLFEYRLEALRAQVAAGDQGQLEAYARAADDLIELQLLGQQWAAAVATYEQAQDLLLAERPGLVLDLLGGLQQGNGPCPATAAEGYERVAQAQILQKPGRASDDLREAMLELYGLNQARYAALKALYAEQRERLRAETEFGLAEEAGPEDPTEGVRLDLKGARIAVVGGYEPIRKRVADALKAQGLGELIHVPPPWEANLTEDQIRARVQNADLVVEVTACVKHSTTVALEHVLEKLPHLRRVYAGGKGKSGILRAVEAVYKAG